MIRHPAPKSVVDLTENPIICCSKTFPEPNWHQRPAGQGLGLRHPSGGRCQVVPRPDNGERLQSLRQNKVIPSDRFQSGKGRGSQNCRMSIHFLIETLKNPINGFAIFCPEVFFTSFFCSITFRDQILAPDNFINLSFDQLAFHFAFFNYGLNSGK